MQIPRWRNLLLLKNSLVPAFAPLKPTTTVAAAAAAAAVASFHSTPVSCEKWKSKSNFDERSKQQTKNHIRYTVHQKRADTKTALKHLLHNSGCSNVSFQDEVPTWKFAGTKGWDSDGSDKKRRSRFSGRHAQKSNHKKVKRKLKRESFPEEFDQPERIFQAKFGDKWYTWSSGGDYSFKNPESGFEWRERSGWTNQRTRQWEGASDAESEEDESYDVGSCSEREILGLPRTGPLKIEDVKNAFRVSALKWHPDKHQGPSQEMAEEKFKQCVDAYKSLCHALS
ncbi:DNA J protein C72 [Hibiscus trionum]|uniref:DNA J protein C72 n=1 Tax=Hibiscus trionum TaxID=183268 RepID=A0A9W7MNP5_HIBTR|nr:DNA J protein C72 [Hibiscus trionum]